MNKFLLKTIILLLVLSFNSFPQSQSEIIFDDIKLSRTRIFFGYSSLLNIKEVPEFRHIFMNVNYRFSHFDPFSKPFSVKWGFEIGVNGLTDINLYGIGILPYLKTGPEIKLAQNLFLGTSIGLAFSVVEYFALIPYAGLNTFYLIPLNKKLFLELESGFHTTFSGGKTPYMVYFATGIAVN